MVTDVPTEPEPGLMLVIPGLVSAVPPAALNAASTAPHESEAASDALAEATPAVAWIRSSAMSFVFGSAGTQSLMVYPLPAAKDAGFVVASAARSKSPLAVVVRLPL